MIDPTKYNNNTVDIYKKLLPYFYRITPETGDEKEVFVNFIEVLAGCLQNVQTALYNKAIELQYFTGYAGFHLTLEKFLNDTYDPVLRRLFITENNIGTVTGYDYYKHGETDPVPKDYYTWGETDPDPKDYYTWQDNEALYNFTINIPLSITYSEDVLRSQLRPYVIATKTYNIITF